MTKIGDSAGRRSSRQAAIFFVAWIAVAGSVSAAGNPARLRFVDDRGQAIDSPLEVCSSRGPGLRQTCTTLTPGAAEPVADGIEMIRVEGPEHGPARLQVRRLERREDGSLLAPVPRKATLRILALPEEPTSLSLYPKDDRHFRQPTARYRPVPPELKIPAGSFVVSLATSGHAPDLKLLDAKPGAALEVEFRRLAGWSLLLRAVTGGDEPLSEALIEVDASPGYAVPRKNRRDSSRYRAHSDASGLTAFSGLSAAIATARLRHSDYFDALVPALSASPGSFEFQQVTLHRGGTARIEVTLDGEPVAAAPCTVLQFSRAQQESTRAPEKVLQGHTDRDGLWRTGRISPGRYTLRLSPPAKTATVRAELRATRLAELDDSAAWQRSANGPAFKG